MKRFISDYPLNPGLYIAKSKDYFCLVQFIGWYPNIKPKKGIILNNFLNENDEMDTSSRQLQVSKDLLNCISYDRGNREFAELEDYINISPIKQKYNSFSSLSVEDKELLYQKYISLLQKGLSWTYMISIIKMNLNCTQEEALSLINLFDEKRWKEKQL
jgi:hypothetical protein